MLISYRISVYKADGRQEEIDHVCKSSLEKRTAMNIEDKLCYHNAADFQSYAQFSQFVKCKLEGKFHENYINLFFFIIKLTKKFFIFKDI